MLATGRNAFSFPKSPHEYCAHLELTAKDRHDVNLLTAILNLFKPGTKGRVTIEQDGQTANFRISSPAVEEAPL